MMGGVAHAHWIDAIGSGVRLRHGAGHRRMIAVTEVLTMDDPPVHFGAGVSPSSHSNANSRSSVVLPTPPGPKTNNN